jgi:hypothetical protein
MYIDTRSTMTETVMLALIKMSSRKLGIGMIIARTIPNTARGTPKSERAPNRDEDAGGLAAAERPGGAALRAFVCAELEEEFAADARDGAVGAISEAAAMAGSLHLGGQKRRTQLICLERRAETETAAH